MPTLQRIDRAFAQIGRETPFLVVYYGTDAAGGWQPLDRPLRTITTLDRFALVAPNGSGHTMRMLQPLELAAAMGFPSSYKWPQSNRREKIRLVGNAVCPPVMRAVIKSLMLRADRYSRKGLHYFSEPNLSHADFCVPFDLVLPNSQNSPADAVAEQNFAGPSSGFPRFSIAILEKAYVSTVETASRARSCRR